jgi:uncharacterized membrane protein YvlD (DUF360 family)
MRLIVKGLFMAVMGAVILGIAAPVAAQPVACFCPFSASWCAIFWIC